MAGHEPFRRGQDSNRKASPLRQPPRCDRTRGWGGMSSVRLVDSAHAHSSGRAGTCSALLVGVVGTDVGGESLKAPVRKLAPYPVGEAEVGVPTGEPAMDEPVPRLSGPLLWRSMTGICIETDRVEELEDVDTRHAAVHCPS